jgi:hypothetical protein
MSQPRQKATAKPTTKVATWWMKAPSFSLMAFCTSMESSFRPASRPPAGAAAVAGVGGALSRDRLLCRVPHSDGHDGQWYSEEKLRRWALLLVAPGLQVLCTQALA